MTDLIALARRWKACKNFRWMKGMRVINAGIIGWVNRKSDGGRAFFSKGGAIVPIEALPDLSDPATAGCLLHQVRDFYKRNFGDYDGGHDLPEEIAESLHDFLDKATSPHHLVNLLRSLEAISRIAEELSLSDGATSLTSGDAEEGPRMTRKPYPIIPPEDLEEFDYVAALSEAAGFTRVEMEPQAVVSMAREIQRLRTYTELHPYGQCECAGDGRCGWCHRNQASIAVTRIAALCRLHTDHPAKAASDKGAARLAERILEILEEKS